ncbi:FadR family transcriptional regulator [Exilibacterium tricleocarpae]|uniref:FadR family transcriptional regulator n=1 Tax=Exilibacterium tricleocarpae TaxID=2591008 RepID=A0A545SY63_9GAMM|nr:FadR/GntR family transcriptional regulator [Exilibacterium tricleocarpae]TQV69900.1 FadR family transcriptional regulator [Exilibacterium tricleocarpae]
MVESNRSLTQTIVQDLGLAIVCGTYSAGNPFPIEAELCKHYQVSRSILREAVKMLTSKGLLNARPRQGTWVEPEQSWNLLDPDVLRWLLERKFSLNLLAEFTEVRLAIEPQAAALAAERGSEAQVAQIQRAIERMEAAEVGDDDPLLADIAFHVAVLEASGNRFYARLQDLIDTALRISIRLTNQFKGVAVASVADHRKVLDGILARDPERARAASCALISEAMELIQKVQSESGKTGKGESEKTGP